MFSISLSSFLVLSLSFTIAELLVAHFFCRYVKKTIYQLKIQYYANISGLILNIFFFVSD